MKMLLKPGVSIFVLSLLLAAPAHAAESFYFLEVPGINGEQSAPGHPDVIQIQSYSQGDHEFSIAKPIDSTSPDFFQAAVNGTLFPTVSLLIYNSTPLASSPDSSIIFQNVLVTSDQIVSLQEQISFNYQSVPEPSAAAASIGCAAIATLRRRRR